MANEPLTHDEAIDALCDCASTVAILSYQEAIEGYIRLRGLTVEKINSLAERERTDAQ